MYTNRLSKLRALLHENGVDGILIASDVNRRYMSGFTGSSGYVIVTSDKALLFSDFRYRTQAPKEAVDYEFIEHGANIMEDIKRAIDQYGVRSLAFEAHLMSVAAFEKYKLALSEVQLVPGGEWVEQLRMVKDADEIAIIKEATSIADKTFDHMIGFIKPGMTELEVALELEFFMRKLGASSTSFDTIIASGERSALPHGVASERVLQDGEFVKMDFGAYYKGYVSDITRTVMLGKPTARHREIYDIVLQAQLAALNGIRPGMTGKEADAIARDMIKAHGYGDQFGHGTGHGIGMEIHESPRLSVTGDIVLQPGMTVTVEPGIYIPGFGGVRIEDDIVITQSGIEILTHATKDFIVIG